MATSTTKSVVFIPTLTAAGKAAALAASNDGLSLKIDAVSFGSQAFSPTGSETTFPNEIKRVSVASAARVSNNQIRMTAIWPADNTTGDIQAVGIWAGTTLVATWSRTTGALGSKTAGVAFVLVQDIVFDQLPSGSLTVSIDPDTALVIALLAAHEAATNPHPGYILSSAFDGLYGGTAVPLVNGVGKIGTAKRFAREDHVHPTDTTRAPLEAPSFTGAVNMASTLTVAGATTLKGAVSLASTLAVTGLATLASATVTGALNVPTQAVGNNTTLAASTAFVTTAISNLVNGAGAALDTLNELATALGNDANFSTTMANALALKAPLAAPSFTGAVSMAGTLGVTGAATFASTLAVTGAATFSSTVGVTGNATIGGTLGVTGKLTAGGDVAITGTTAVSGNQYLYGTSFFFQPSTAASARFEIGYIGGTATTPYIDFHSGATATDYDVRLIASGGTGTAGAGSLTLYGAAFNVNAALKVTGEIQNANGVAYRQVAGNYGSFWYSDGAALYMMLTASGDQYGSYNTLRPLAVNLTSGAVSIGNGLTSAGTTTLQGQTTLTTSSATWGLQITDTGTNGAVIKLIGDGTTTPNKYLQVLGGTFRLLNSAYSSALFTVSDAGDGGFAGALAVAGVATFGTTVKSAGEFQTTAANAFRMVYGNYGAFWRQDGSNLWLMLTASGDQYGSYNSLRPLAIGLTDGKVTFGHQVTFSSATVFNGQMNVNTSGSSTSLVITDTGSNGANLKLTGNGTTTPSKSIRVNAGVLQIINDAYSAQIFTLSDAGNGYFAGTLSAAGAVSLSSTLTVTGNASFSGGAVTTSGVALIINPSGYNGSIELGDTKSGTATTPYIDFHSGATATDYDFRVIASGGTGTAGAGTLSLLGAAVSVQAALTATKAMTINVAGASSQLTLNGDAGQFRMVRCSTAGVVRWDFGADYVAEGGSNAGTNFYVNRFADDGSYLDSPILITRATGVINLTSVAVATAITMPTQARTDSSTKGATTAFVKDLFGVKGVATRFTASGTWVCPTGVTVIYISACGGGGGGGGGAGFSSSYGAGGGGGGGAAEFVIMTPVAVTPGVTYTITIGAGGPAGASGSAGNPGSSGTNGGITSFAQGSTTLITLQGGVAATGGNVSTGAGGIGGNYGGQDGGDAQGGSLGGDGGSGGSGPFGTGGGGGRAGTPGGVSPKLGLGYGTGGGGGGASWGSSGSGAAGGAGTPGFLMIQY